MLKRVTVVAFLLLFANAASAAILVDFVSKTATATGFEYKYAATLQPSALLKPGEYFAIYDFAGLTDLSDTDFEEDAGVPGHDPSVSRWTVSQQDSGPKPLFGVPVDNATLPNVKVTLGGSSNIVPVGASVLLGTLTLASPFAAETTVSYAALFTSQNTSNLGYNVSTVAGPIPEPSTYALMGVGLLSVVGVALCKRRRMS